MGMSIGKCIGKIMDSACYHIRAFVPAPIGYLKPKILSLFYVSFIFRAVSVERSEDVHPCVFDFKSNNICGMMGRCEYKNLYIGYVSHSVGNASGYISCLTRARRPKHNVYVVGEKGSQVCILVKVSIFFKAMY